MTRSTGRPRELHREQALACISFDAAPQPAQKRTHVGSYWTTVTRLVRICSRPVVRARTVRS